MTPREDLIEVIYRIAPTTSPLFYVPTGARVKKRVCGKSMRQRRRAMAKPEKFTPKRPSRFHEWQLDKLIYKV